MKVGEVITKNLVTVSATSLASDAVLITDKEQLKVIVTEGVNYGD